MMFSGLRSRWTTPAWCAAASPAATSPAMASARATGNGPDCRRMCASVWPSTNGIVRYLMPPTSPRSWMRTTLRWVTCRARSSSRLNRRSTSRAETGSAITSGRMTFSATATAAGGPGGVSHRARGDACVRYRTPVGRDRDDPSSRRRRSRSAPSSAGQCLTGAAGRWSTDCSQRLRAPPAEEGMMDGLLQDVRYGLRVLVKTPVVTGVAILTLALGIGANTAIFSLADAFLWSRLPVKDPEQLVFVHARMPSGRALWSFPYTTFEQFRDSNHSLSGLFAYDDSHVAVTIDGQPEYVDADFVSGSYFDVLGVSAALGRTFTAE